MRAAPAAVAGVIVALAVAGLAIAKRQRPSEAVRAVDTTTAIRIVRRDGLGLPERKGTTRDPAHVRELTEALGVDVHPGAACPPDYADADVGLVLSGNDVYARRNVYIFGLLADGGVPSVVSVTSAGCHAGPPADLASLRRELHAAKILD